MLISLIALSKCYNIKKETKHIKNAHSCIEKHAENDRYYVLLLIICVCVSNYITILFASKCPKRILKAS